MPMPCHAPALPVFRAGDRVTYLGHPAIIVHGNEPGEWTDGTGATVNLRFDPPARGMSSQIDMHATALLSA